MKKNIHILLFIVIFLIFVTLTTVFSLSRRSNVVDYDVTTTSRTDTVVIRDTIRDTLPQITKVLKGDTKFIVLPHVDTLNNKTGDSVKVELLYTDVEYKTDKYKAIVSGYNPSLKYIETYGNTEYITKETTHELRPIVSKKIKRWGVGIQTGVGLSTTDVKLSYYIGVGIQYNFITW